MEKRRLLEREINLKITTNQAVMKLKTIKLLLFHNKKVRSPKGPHQTEE